MTTQSHIEASFNLVDKSLLVETDFTEDKYIRSLDENVLKIRDDFVNKWTELTHLSLTRVDLASSERSTRNQHEEKIQIKTKEVYDSLKRYTFFLHKTEFVDFKYILGEEKDTLVDNVSQYLENTNADPSTYIPLLDTIKFAHNKELLFRRKAFKILKKELLFKVVALSEQNRALEEELNIQEKKLTNKIDKVRTTLSKQLAECQIKQIEAQSKADHFSQEYQTI